MSNIVHLSLAIDVVPAEIQPDEQERGMHDWKLGTAWRNDALIDGFAFCQYEPGTVEHDNWVLGYEACAFDSGLITRQYQADA